MRAKPRWAGTLVRFSLGLEDVDDLIDDCRQALQALAGAERAAWHAGVSAGGAGASSAAPATS